MKKAPKKLLALFLVAGLSINSFSIPNTVNAATKIVVLSESIESNIVTDGLVYEKKSKLTNLGWVDIYVLKMDLTNPNVDLDIVRSSDIWSQKDTLTTLIKESGDIAAVNGSFFDTAHNPSDIIGAEFEGGSYTYLKEDYNKTSLGAASLFVDAQNQVSTKFFSGNITVRNDKYQGVYVTAINGMSDFVNSVIINSEAMKDTAQIEGKGKLYKVVVQNDVVIEVVAPKVVAQIPEGGYVLTINETLAAKVLPNFPVGTHMVIDVKNNLYGAVYDLILSGGGRILKDGLVVREGLIVEPNYRHPRTAIGVTTDGKTLISMVVDGRGSSIGATHDELALYLKEYDVANAIHMDGGGSSTIASRTLGTDKVVVNNTPSDGKQRKVVNGLGFVSTAEQGTLAYLKVTPSAARIFKNMPVTYTVVGYDEHYNPIPVEANSLTWSNVNMTGTWNENTFTPTSAGVGTITGTYNSISTTATLTCMDSYIDLDADPKILYVEPGASGGFKIMGTDSEGYKGQVNLNNVNWVVDNPNLGYFQNGVFYAGQETGIGNITISSGDVELKAYVVVGKQTQVLTTFDDIEASTSTYPESAVGHAQITDAFAYDGNKSLQLDYSLPVSDVTQAVYGIIKNVTLSDVSNNKIGLYVYGDGNGLMLKGKVIDANGASQYITFSDGISTTGWQYLETTLPSDMVYPLRLERLYVANLKTAAPITGTFYIDLLTTPKKFDVSGLKFALDVPLKDPMRLKDPAGATFRATVFGASANKNRLLDTLVLNQVTQAMNNYDLAIFAGKSSVNTNALTTKSYVWNNTYSANVNNSIKFINLATSSGGVIDTDYTQWTKLQQELKNTPQNNIVIIANNNPINKDGFIDQREGQLLHGILKDFQKKTGKTIYYVNASGYKFNVNYYEGIHYMDINGLWYRVSGSEVDLNSSFYLLDFYLVKDKLYYNYENIYPQVN